MAGTWATFQGHHCSSVQYKCSRGWTADESTVTLPVKYARGKFKIIPPGDSVPYPVVDPKIIEADLKPQSIELPSDLKAYGSLVIYEHDGNKKWPEAGPLVIPNLHVVRAEVVRYSRTADIAALKLTLVDERFFWPRGVMSQWEFNPIQGRSAERPTVRSIVDQYITPAIPGRPTIIGPEAWETDSAPRKFDAFCTGAVALRAIQTDYDLEEPCLQAANVLATPKKSKKPAEPAPPSKSRVLLPTKGTGKVGHGPDNKLPIPDSAILWQDGRGESFSHESAWLEDVITIVGGPAVASVQMDDCTPVLKLDKRTANLSGDVLPNDEPVYVPLTDDVVRGLTNGVLGLADLQSWILAAPEHQANPEIPESTIRLLREQAWRLYMVPGAKVWTGKPEFDTKPYVPAKPKVINPDGSWAQVGKHTFFVQPGTPLLPDQSEVSAESFLRAESLRAEPGPNADCLPMLDTAEKVGQLRLAPYAEIYRHISITRALDTLVDVKRLQYKLVREADNRRRQIEQKWLDPGTVQSLKKLFSLGEFLPDEKQRAALSLGTSAAIGTVAGGPAALVSAAVFYQLLNAQYFKFDQGEILPESSLEGGILWAMVDEARRARDMETTGFVDAAAYDAALDEYYRQKDAGGDPKFVPLRDLAKRSVALENSATELKTPAQEALRALQSGKVFDRAQVLKALDAQIKAIKTAIRNRSEQIRAKAILEKAEGKTQKRRQEYLVWRNVARARDTGMQVIDARNGVFRLSTLPGWLEGKGEIKTSSRYSWGPFVPMPVRITFGSHRAPKAPGTRDPLVRSGEKPQHSIEWFHRAGQATTLYNEKFGLEPDGSETVSRRFLVRSGAGNVYRPENQKEAAGRLKTLGFGDLNKRLDKEGNSTEGLEVSARIHRPDLVDLIPLSGRLDGDDLDGVALNLALEKSKQLESRVSEQMILAHAWHVNCDGTVANVEISSRTRQGTICGFETKITTGSNAILKPQAVKPPKQKARQ